MSDSDRRSLHKDASIALTTEAWMWKTVAFLCKSWYLYIKNLNIFVHYYFLLYIFPPVVQGQAVRRIGISKLPAVFALPWQFRPRKPACLFFTHPAFIIFPSLLSSSGFSLAVTFSCCDDLVSILFPFTKLVVVHPALISHASYCTFTLDSITMILDTNDNRYIDAMNGFLLH